MARLVTIAVSIFAMFVLAALSIGDDVKEDMAIIAVAAVAFLLFVYAIYRGAKQMQKELTTINAYLANLDSLDEVSYKARFFTKEFEEINRNLIKALKKAKKREDIKRRYNAKLKLKNRQRADMLSAIAHEFRNPVAAIMGYAQTLNEDDDVPDDLRKKFLEKIYNNGNKIEALLSRLILWNKFESGEATLHKAPLDLYRAAEEVKRSLQEKYKGRVVEVGGERVIVDADPALIDIVLKNLVENALKYSKERVVVTVERDGSVHVRDFGVGIDRSDLEKITKKFYRSGTHSWDNSMGLGLSIVKTILRLHESELEIESRLNEGSTFSFRLPVSERFDD